MASACSRLTRSGVSSCVIATIPSLRHGPPRHHRCANLRRRRGVGAAALPSQVQEEERGVSTSQAVEFTSATPSKLMLPEAAVDWSATGRCFAFPALGGMLFGYDIGASSGVLTSLTATATSGTDWGPALTALESGTVVGSALWGALAGSLAALGLGDALGRRKEMLASATCYAGGAALLSGASGLSMLLVGRVTYGIGIGLAMHAAPAYICETVPASVRGLLISCKEALIVLGILLGYVLAYVTAEDVGGWREIYAAAMPLAAIFAAGVVGLPESPRWLQLSGGGRAAAERALVAAEGSHAADPRYVASQIDQIESSAMETAPLLGDPKQGRPGLALLEPRYWRPLAVGCSVVLFQQLTGQPSVLYLAAPILGGVGFQEGRGAASIAVLLGTFKLAMTGVAIARIETQGRRPLLLSGASGMVMALLVLGATQNAGWQASVAPALALHLPSGVPVTAWLSAAALLLYVGCYQLSFGPIAWLLLGELFPLRVRSQALAVASLINFGSNAAVATALPPVMEALGLSNTYFLFGAIGIGAVACMSQTVPETKGRTLEEIEASWGRPQ